MRWLGAAMLAVLIGCGGASSPDDNGAPLSPSEAAAACETTCAHAVACGWETDAMMCESVCTAGSSLFRGSGYAAWMDCINGTDCAAGVPGEGCYVVAADAADPRAVHDEYVTSCQGVATACPTVTLPSGVCDLDNVILFADTYVTGVVLPCFDQPCDQISACLETVVLDAF